MENMDPELDLILGSKSLFELEVTVNCERQHMQFLQRSVNAYVKYPVEVAAGTSQTIDLTVPAIKDGQVKHWMPSRCLTKLDLSHGGDHLQKEFQTMEAFVDQDRTFQVTVTNDSAKDLILPKNFFAGGVDLRSTSYFFKDQDMLVNSFLDECAFLNDESTLNEMFAFLEKVNKLNDSVPAEKPKIDPDDPYLWLEKDDLRQTMTDMESIEKFINLDDSVLTPDNKKHFQKILLKYKDAFSLRDEVGVCPYLKVLVEMKDKSPFFVCPYGVKEDQKKWVDKEMQKGCLLGYMRQGMSSYSSPIMLIPRKNSSVPYRTVVDFWVLNSRIVSINLSIPLVRDVMQQISSSECEILSVIDLQDAYHTLRLDEESQQYCGITPYSGSLLYLMTYLPMWLSISPAVWMQFITKVMMEIQTEKDQELQKTDPNTVKVATKHHLAVMDDIIMHSKMTDHVTELIRLFKVLIKYGLKISLKKCQFFRKHLTYMGHDILMQDGRPCIQAHKSRVDAIRVVKTLTTVKEAWGFCGMANFLGMYIKDMAKMLAPIYDLTCKGVKFEWTEECQKSFEAVKQARSEAPVLVLPNRTGLFQLQSDTSKTGCGGALFQVQDGELRLLGY